MLWTGARPGTPASSIDTPDVCPLMPSRSRFVRCFTSAYAVTAAGPTRAVGAAPAVAVVGDHPNARSTMSQHRSGEDSAPETTAMPDFPDLPEATVARLPE